MPVKLLQENLGKVRKSVSCLTAILNTFLGGDWKYMSRNPACSVREEESWWRPPGADGPAWGFGPCLCYLVWGGAKQGCGEGKRTPGTRGDSSHPSALRWQVHNPLGDLKEIGKRGRSLKYNSCKWCGWTEEQEGSLWSFLEGQWGAAGRGVLHAGWCEDGNARGAEHMGPHAVQSH